MAAARGQHAREGEPHEQRDLFARAAGQRVVGLFGAGSQQRRGQDGLAVEAQLGIKGPAPEKIRPVIVRPSFIWNWKKLDILPLIPVFNTASALGVPFVDKTVRVETLAKALVAGIDDGAVSGVKRYMDMEALAERLP